MANHRIETTVDELAEIASALGEPKRLLALAMLQRGELCLCDLTDGLGVAPSTVSNHMAILKRSGLVRSRKDGRWMHFRLAEEDASPVVSEALRWALSHLPKSVIPSSNCTTGDCCP